MKSISEIRNRRSIRLKTYDYSQAGAYFVTICAQKKECIFGRVVDGGMELNEAGKTIGYVWSGLPTRYASVELDEVVIMPNHIHGIIVINNSYVGAGLALPAEGAASSAPTMSGKGAASSAPTLSDIVRTFKSISTRRSGQPVWQRNYFDRIIRNEDELNRIRQYIVDNPLQWQFDRENPAAKNSDGEEEIPWRASA